MTDQLTTVRGIARHPWLNSPDTKFDADGLYKVTLELPAAVAAPLIAEYTALQKKAMADYQAQKKGKKAIATDLPITPKLDEDLNETGMYELKVKMKASGTSQRTGKPYTRKLPLFDSFGNPTNAQIGGGSDINVSFKASPWSNAKGECSVTCYLEAVQIIRLVTGGAVSSDRFGFGKVDGGFAAEEQTDSGVTPTDDASSYDFD